MPRQEAAVALTAYKYMAEITLESSISWLDYAEDDRRKMMEIVSLMWELKTAPSCPGKRKW